MDAIIQLPLFPAPAQDIPIPGFAYRRDFIGAKAEQALIRRIDAHPWDSTWKRRVQQYGFSYGGRRESLGEMPAWLAALCDRLAGEGIFAETPNQVIVNEYLPGQGIAAHVDYLRGYGGTVASLSLGSPVVMDFTDPDGKKHPFLLEPRSLFILAGPARYEWKHGIAPRRIDRYRGALLTRGRRLSCTFRNTYDKS